MAFEDLQVWQMGHELAVRIFRACEGLPPRAMCIGDQVTRAAVSVPANIAEGYALHNDRQFRRHLKIAQGSLAETRYLLLLMRDTGLVTADGYDALIALAHSLTPALIAFIHKVEERLAQKP